MKLSRRLFLTSTALAAGLALAGPQSSHAGADPLQARVASGELPPLDERLPKNPVVVTPTERPGKPGGTWNHALVGGGSLVMLTRYQGYEPLLRFNPEWTDIEPNVAESFSVNDDATVYSFTLREGLKWSDGVPFTTEDIRFWYEDIFLDPDVSITRSQSYWTSGGEVGTLEIIDDHRFNVVFKEPNGFFAQQLAWAEKDATTRTPAHYLKQFHKKYNENADALAQENGAEGWVQMIQRQSGLLDSTLYYQNSKRPTLNAWAFTSAPGEDTERAVAERNPFYFKVDTQGTQLPYFDKVVYQMVADPQVLLLKTLQGEIDMMDQYIGTPSNKPVLFDGQERGDYSFYTLKQSAANAMVFQLNLNHVDPVKNELFNNRDFREALSIAVDRQALIDGVFVGQGEPAQPSIREGDPLYNERLATQHTEYDPDRANEILDTIIAERDGEGYRLDREGRRVTVIFEIDQARKTFLDMFELALPMFRDVGIDAQMRTMDRSLWETRVRGGREYDATAHQFGANGGLAAMLDARYFVPFSRNSMYAPGWALYYSDPDNPNAIKPPADILALQERYKQLLATGDPAEQKAMMTEILDEAAEQFFVFGVTLPPDGYGIVKNDMVNTMPVMINSWGWPTPGPTRPEQFFKE